MNLINKIKLSLFYRDLKRDGIDTQLLEQALSDKKFSKKYKKEIVKFVKYLKNYTAGSANIFNDYVTPKLDDETITQHLNSILKTYRKGDSVKYISFVKANSLESKKLENVEVLNDDNFDKLFELFKYDVFDDSIKKIVTNGCSERFLQFHSMFPEVGFHNIDVSLFEDKVWNTIISNQMISNTPIFKIFNTKEKIGSLIELIKKDLFNGLKYTFENIPESNKFITEKLTNFPIIEQFDMSFINNIEKETLKKLYLLNIFSTPECKRIFEIAACGNFELIKDIVNCCEDDKNELTSKKITEVIANLKEEDLRKNLLEIDNISQFEIQKYEILLNKYFGINIKEAKYIKLFLTSINKITANNEFKEKYGSLLELLNIIYNANDDEIIELSHKLNVEKKEEYRKLIYECEKDGNEQIKEQFSKDLRERNEEILSTATHSVITDQYGYSLDVYELDGQPFTMLVHAITSNVNSNNNSLVPQLIKNPTLWNDESITGNNHISTSLISDKYMATYGIPNDDNCVMFGFYDVPSEYLKFTSTRDAGFSRDANITDDDRYNMRKWISMPRTNTVATIDELMAETIKQNEISNSNIWNEIGLLRKDRTTREILKPNYIVCMDSISEASKRAARMLQIPTYLIKRNGYIKTEKNVEKDETLSETYQVDNGGMKR